MKNEKTWLKKAKKEKLVSMVTSYFHEVDDTWSEKDSKRVVRAVEKLVFPSIDLERLYSMQLEKNGCVFEFCISNNVCSDELFDLLLEYQPEKWHFIKEMFMIEGLVDLTYEDRYLNTPLGCLMLAQLIRRIRDLFRLNYRSINISLSHKDFRVMFDDKTLKIDRKFSYSTNRDAFMKLCMERIVRSSYKLETRNVKHSRILTVKSCRFLLEIYPEGGLSYGWGIENGIDQDLSIDQLVDNIDRNIHCFNRASHSYDRKGIQYMVKLIPIQNDR